MKTTINQYTFSLFFLLPLFLFITFNCKAQFYISEDLDADYYQLRVKHIEDFMNRFNYTQDARGEFLHYTDSLKNQRAGLIFTLFSKPLIQQYFERDSLGNWLAYTTGINIMERFIKQVALDSVPQFLQLDGNNWMAENKCRVKYKGKPDSITLFMSFKYDSSQQLSNWVIDSCAAPFLVIKATNKINLSPVSHNMNFMQIGKASEFNPDDFSALAYNGFKPDNLSVLFYAIKNRILSIEYVEETTFNFWQIPGYYFTVKNIPENSAHSGWLISSIKKNNSL